MKSYFKLTMHNHNLIVIQINWLKIYLRKTYKTENFLKIQNSSKIHLKFIKNSIKIYLKFN